MLSIPGKYRPIAIAVLIIGGAALIDFAVDVFDIGEPPAENCCATGWDPAPYQQVPAERTR